MGGNTQDQSNKNDDDSSSIASFEHLSDGKMTDVHSKEVVIHPGRRGNDKPIQGDEDADEVVPPVLYVVQYSDRSGRVLETRKSNTPPNLMDDDGDMDSGQKKPVIEILTKVINFVVGARRGPGMITRPAPPRRGSFCDYSDSSDDDSSTDHGCDGQPASNMGKVHKTEMIIHSEPLKNALSAVVGYCPGAEFIGTRVSVPAPYRVLIHHREALAAYKFAQPACHTAEQVAETSRHIDVLLAFLEETYGARIREEEQRHQNKIPSATYDWYWLLFRPGEVVYKKERNMWAPCVISRVHYDGSDGMGGGGGNDERMTFNVECWNLRFSAGRVRRVMKTISTRLFTGEQAIHGFSMIPAAFFPASLEKLEDGVTMAEKQIALGRAYWELVQRPVYKEYDGPLVDRGRGEGITGRLNGRVVVDAEGYERFCAMAPKHGRAREMRAFARPTRAPPLKDNLPYFSPRCNCRECTRQQRRRQHQQGGGDSGGWPARREETGPFSNFEDLNPCKDKPPANELYFLVLAKDVAAFILGERRWGHVRVERLREVKTDKEAFRHLVLDEQVKLTVKSLIGKFASDDGKVTPWPRDLIKNKGEGRIFLLHGPPGVGKTATCEAAAELGQRPLLALTSGDINTGGAGGGSVEQNLNYFLTIGERYGALVLLDEADVYLEQRRTRDMVRNGLVSVFLRALEYYKGVLFLTTNRVEAFDSAFTSRIHVALHYPRLTDDDRRRVWDNNFERLERDSAGRVRVLSAARDFVRDSDEIRRLRMNGRQIKNALQVAVSLADTEAGEGDGDGAGAAVVVAERHIRSVVQLSQGFKDFMRHRKGPRPGWGHGADEADCDSSEDEDDSEESDSEVD